LGKALVIGAAIASLLAGMSALAADIRATDQLAAAGTNEYRVQNKCSYPVRALLHMVDAQRGWRTFGWYDLQPGAMTDYLATPNRYVYYRVQKADGALAPSRRSDGTRHIRVGAKVHELHRINIGKQFRKFTHIFCR
jgi:hypothetical protein